MADTKKVTYLGPSELVDFDGTGDFVRVPKGGLEVSLSETQIKSMRANGHRFEGYEVRDAEAARPHPVAYNRDPEKYRKAMEAQTVEEEPVDVGAGLGITTAGDSGADVTNDNDATNNTPTTGGRNRSR